MAGYPKILHTEEAMRDGLQIEDKDISAADKILLLDALSETGLKEITVGSFVSPRWTPQMASIEEVVRGFTPRPGVRYTYLALNDKGRERARAFIPPLSPPVADYSTRVDMCDVFAQRNNNRTQLKQIESWSGVVTRAKAAGLTEGGMALSNPWGSNWTGDVTQDERLGMLERMHRLWTEAGFTVTRIGFFDAMSWNMPGQVAAQLAVIKERWPSITDFQLHLHNGRGTALTSVWAALGVLDSGDTLRLQSAIGGMGGCPYCGNGRAAMMIPTEDLMHLLEETGIYTGVDLYRLVEAVWLAEKIVGHPLYGHVSKAGPRPRGRRLYPLDLPCIETLDQAKHFILGPGAYEGAPSPWPEPIRSHQRPDSQLKKETICSD